MIKTIVRLFLSIISVMAVQQASAQLSSYSFTTLTGIAPEDMSIGTTLLIGPNSDDNISSALNIGFIFTFNGTSYTQFSFNSNGLMHLGSDIITGAAANQLTASNDNPKIAPYWDDLHTGTDGKVHYKLIGSSPNRKLCVEWNVTVPKNSAGPSNAKFQAWLFETTNVIQFVYASAAGILANPGGYSVGLASSATDFLSITTSTNSSSTITENNSNTSAIAALTSYKFTPAAATGIPNCATISFPSNNATGVTTSPILTWTSGGGAPSGYDVYFGTAVSPPLVSTNQVSTNYVPAALTGNTNYYWKVVPRNSFGAPATCTVYHFTTFTPVNYDVARTAGISYSSISSTGTSISSWRNGTNTDDNLSNSIPIGFNFTYQGTTFTNVLVSTNGFMTLNTSTLETGGGSSYGPDNTGLSSTSLSTLAPFYDDLVCQGNPYTSTSLSSSIKYSVAGSTGSRVFTVEWLTMQTYGNTGPNLNFQVKLYESTNNVEFIYGTMEGFNGTSNNIFTYSCGINASYISTIPATGELLCQQLANTRSFGKNVVNNLTAVPDCNSKVTFTLGNYTIYVPVVTTVSNDEPAGAIALSVNSSPCVSLCGTYYSSAGATLSSAVPVCTGNADDDVWFSFVATNPSTTIKVLNSGGYDAVVQLLNSSLASITCQNSTGQGLTESIVTAGTLTVGNTYYVRVYNSSAGSGFNGKFSICISATLLPPSNDNCSGAIILAEGTSLSLINGSNTLAATASTGVPSPCNSTVADDDVWYSFTSIATVATIVVQSGIGFDAAVELFSGNCASLTVLQCANATSTDGTETINLTGLSVGLVYYIRVYHASIGAGTGSFRLGVYATAPVCPTSFNPANGTAHVDINGITLSWQKVSDVTGYDVYMDVVNPPIHLQVSNTPDTSIITGALTAGNIYYWKVIPRNGSVTGSGCFVNVFSPPQPDAGLYVKVFIEGFYLGGGMMQAVVDPVNRPGVTDTIHVSLARNVSPYDIMYTCKAILNTNGMAHCFFPAQALLGNYYIVVNHRNALETWSYQPFGYNTNDTTFNFSSPRNSALRVGRNQQPVIRHPNAPHANQNNPGSPVDDLPLPLRNQVPLISPELNFEKIFLPEEIFEDPLALNNLFFENIVRMP
ncbi:MAG: hypothetical protein NT126_09375 [Bacteroidetes bacterium]|nr:hypothetical protein [Bacteroidota bacterium]